MLRGPVLVGTDLSPESDEALRQGQQLASALDTRLLVCHVMPELLRVGVLFPQWRLAGPRETEVRTAAQEAVVRQIESVLGESRPEVEILLESGTPHAGLLTQAVMTRAGTVVVAPGATAAQVVRHVGVPVLVARPSPPSGPVIGTTDFSKASDPALDEAADEARRRNAPLLLVHAFDVALFTLGTAPEPALPYLTGQSPIALEGLDELRGLAVQQLEERLARSGLAGRAIVVDGHATSAIVSVAESERASLVVAGTHGRSGLARLALGSTATALLEQAPCSVLVVRAAD
ncbi:MAG TPA: universal stress protein [Vicinamibacterales bacterium]